MDYSQHFNTKKTPVTQPIAGRKREMILNSTGGFGFKLSPQNTVKRFLILGTDGGTYYASEKKLTIQNAESIAEIARNGESWLVEMIVEVAQNRLAPKPDAGIFALAVAATYGTAAVKKQAYDAIPKVCNIGTHIYSFCQAIQNLRGWSRGLRRGVGNYYSQKPVENFAYDVLKYRQRNGWTPLDVIRLSHPKLDTEGHKAIIGDLKGSDHILAAPPVWEAYREMSKLKPEDWKKAIELIETHNLPWEALPTELHGRKEIWESLLPKMPIHALIRNLSRFAKLGITSQSGMDKYTKFICEKRFLNEEYIKKSKVHPMTLLIASRSYGLGRSPRGKGEWDAVPKIVAAMDRSFYSAFKNVKPTGKSMMLALDVSGSMTWEMANGISARELSAALALVTANVEKDVWITGFTGGITTLDIRPTMAMEDVLRKIENLNFSSTNMSLCFQLAAQEKVILDAFVVYTDNEVNCGGHPSETLKKYRKIAGVESKAIMVGMTATDFSVADPKDPNMMDVAGFSADTPQIISSFIAGEI